MAECTQETESNVEDTTNANSIEFMSLPSESEFSAVIFNNVPECYPPDREIECRYTIKSSVKPNSRDWIGLFKVGWQSSREHYTYEWSPLPNIQNGERDRPLPNRVLFRERYLPRADDEFYQFCYVTYVGDIRGASVPFQIKTKPIELQDDLECCEIEDDDGSSIMLVKNKTAILEEALGRALEENAVLTASKETAEADLADANEKIMGLESRKVELTTSLKEIEKKSVIQETVLAQKTQMLEEEQRRRKDLKSTANDSKIIQENSDRRIDELMMIVEQERAQSSEVVKNKEKLVVERKQYLDSMTADRQMIDKLQNDLKTKEDEHNSLKARFMELKTKARSESVEFAEKLEKISSVNEKLHEQLAQITADNGLLKRNMEEESDRLTKKLRDAHLELKCKGQELQNAQQEIANFNCMVANLESSKEEILKDASHEAELLGKNIEKLRDERKEKQELLYQLEQELEDVKSQLNHEKGKVTALEEDYESVIRALQDQLEGEKALNNSLCSQSDRNVASLQGQVQKQLETNMELSGQLDTRMAEIRGLCDELDDCKRQLHNAEEKVQKTVIRFTAADVEIKSLKVDRENLQTTLTDTQGASTQSSKNSAASMYALQTAHAHVEKSYLKVKKERDELWRERNELKRTVAAFEGNVSSDDLRLRIEELRACNEDLRVRLNMGAEAYKMKFIECRQLEAKMNKLKRTSSVESLESVSVLEMQSVVVKLRKTLDEEKKALSVEKSMMFQKNEEINQLKLEIFELREKVKYHKHQQLQKANDTQSQLVVEELLEKLASLERNFEVEKGEKESIIHEIVNLEAVLRRKDDEIGTYAENLKALQDALTREQADRETLGEQARQKILAHEDNERKLDLKGKELSREVERWKKEVDMYVEAESRMMENRSEETVKPSEQPQPEQEQHTPSAQGFMPVRGIRPPWSRPTLIIPHQVAPQPWVLVNHPPDHASTGPSPVVSPQPYSAPVVQPGYSAPVPGYSAPVQPGYSAPVPGYSAPVPGYSAPVQPGYSAPVQPLQPSAPAPEPEVPQCPVCKALLPPSVNRDEHVNSHFD